MSVRLSMIALRLADAAQKNQPWMHGAGTYSKRLDRRR
jgi:hypothetical protein